MALSASLTPLARQDIREILAWSTGSFGPAAASRYRNLLVQALLDLASDPLRPGSRERPELAPGIRTYHLAMSRKRTPGVTVQSPRHFILYRTIGGRIEIVRVLHDSRDFNLYIAKQD